MLPNYVALDESKNKFVYRNIERKMMNFEEREKMLIELEEKNYYKDEN